MNYPEMNVEKRVSTNAWGIKPPMKESDPEYAVQMQEMIDLCEYSELGAWHPRVLEILIKHSPVETTAKEIIDIQKELGFRSWKQTCDFVKDDECPEYYIKLLKYTKKYKFKHKLDFLDGQGLGVNTRYLADLEKISQKSFDVKWYYKRERPLEELKNKTGIDFSCMSNYIHPGHYAYIAQHSVKFYQAVDTISNEYELNEHKRKLVLSAYVTSMGRSGVLVHRIEDNIAALVWFNF